MNNMLKKIFIGFGVVFVLLLATAMIIPYFYKDEINAKIKEQINKELKADVDYSSYSLSMIKGFPNLFFSLNDLSVVGRDVFAGDTLLHVDKLGLGLDFMKLIKQESLLVHELSLVAPKIFAYTLIDELSGDTLSNYDIMPSSSTSSDTSSSLIDIDIKNLNISNGDIIFTDIVKGYQLVAKQLNTKTRTKLVKDNIEVNTKTTINELSYGDKKTQYLNKVALNAALDMLYNTSEKKIILKENSIALNKLKVKMQGTVKQVSEDHIAIDVNYVADQSSFKELLSMIPIEYMKNYDGVKADGLFDLKGNVIGNLTKKETPSFLVDLNVKDAKIQYPNLPSAIEQINLKATVSNQTNRIENTNIDIPKATFTVLNEPISMSLNAKNVASNALVDLKVKGVLPIARIPEFYPIENFKDLQGDMELDFAFKGLLKDVENKNYEKVHFDGNVNIARFLFASKDFPLDIQINRVELAFNPRTADLKIDNMQLGESNFNVTGSVENIINYVLSDGVVSAVVNIQSDKINVDELLLGQNNTSSSSESEITQLPKKINFEGTLSANELLYDSLSLKNVAGKVKLLDQRLFIQNVQADMLGGHSAIKGYFDTKAPQSPKLALTFDVKGFDMKQSFNKLTTVKAITPLLKYLDGSYNASMTLDATMNSDMSLNLNSLNGLGDVRIPKATITHMPMLDNITKALKMPAFINPTLQNAWTVLKIRDGKVDVEPFTIKVQDIAMKISGSNGFDKTIDYNLSLSVPTDKFGGAASIANNFLAQQKIPLLNLAVPTKINFDLNVLGPMSNPKVKIVKVTGNNSSQSIQNQIRDNLQQTGKQIKDQVVDEAKDQLDQVKETIKDQVNGGSKGDAREQVQDQIDKAKESIKDRIKGFGW